MNCGVADLNSIVKVDCTIQFVLEIYFFEVINILSTCLDCDIILTITISQKNLIPITYATREMTNA